VSSRRAELLEMRRRLLVAEAALQRARLRHEVQVIGAAMDPAAWVDRASRRWPWLSLAATLLPRRRSAPSLLLSAALLAWRWWRRRRPPA
jgi:hypothetical protein